MQLNGRRIPLAMRRHYSSGVSARCVRQHFLDFFLSSNGHKWVRSSPVVPFCDPTLAFVNAGMNQFKGVLLGRDTPLHRRVVNSQKCVRVGGKHNDLNVVGTDGYHHTFFEMLGNWSFGDYFKEEACHLAWTLITGPLSIDPRRLYVTYFGGNERLGLPPDTECRDIWRRIGLPPDRILPFGMEENFWEMGQSGPCGPCTEIHIDHTGQGDRALAVNMGLADLTELWNIVFIQYNREEDGSVSSLPECHVDTGMGLERLVAIQQGSRSNYDTDLFTPLFDSIQKVSKCEPYRGTFSATAASYHLDTAYRIIADHSRMILACLADGMIPDQNHKLRRILRRALLVSERSFCQKRLLHEVIPRVAEVLGDTYPEMKSRLPDVLQIVSHEGEVFNILRQSSSQEVKKLIKDFPHLEELDVLDSPGFVLAFEELQKHKIHFNVASSGLPIIPSDLLFKFYDTYGLDRDTLEHLACLEKLQMDLGAFEEHMRMAKRKTSLSRKSTLKLSPQDVVKIPKTDTQPKYEYSYVQEAHTYRVPAVEAKVLAIVVERETLKSLEGFSGDSFAIIVDKSNFYSESGGQEGDFGTVVLPSGLEMPVKGVENLQNRLLHTIVWKEGADLRLGDSVTLHVNTETRSGNILHHTATHLLNAAVRKITQGVVYQRSSSVTSSGMKMEFGVYGEKKLDVENLQRLEGVVREAIGCGIPLNITSIDSQELLLRNQEVTMVPGEVYPDRGLRLVEIVHQGNGFQSRELCCGTHARSTRELEDFCLTGVRSVGRASYVVTGVAGKAAIRAQEMGRQMTEDVQVIKRDLETGKQQIEHLEARVHRLKNMLQHGFQENLTIPHTVKVTSLDTLNAIAKRIRSVTRETLKEFIEIEMKNVLEDNPPDVSPFIVHYLSSASLMESVQLQKATRLCPDRPILVISLTGGEIKARCCVPEKCVTEEFSAELWLQDVARVFKSSGAAPKGQDGRLVCNMKGKKIKFSAVDSQLETALTFARDYASKFMPR